MYSRDVPGRPIGTSDSDTTYPGAMSDAGVVFFDGESKVDTSKFKGYVEGVTHYCIAPVLKNGVGGGFYAIGQNCCANDKFTCVLGDQGLVVTNLKEKYTTALNALELEHGKSFHDRDAKKGVVTDAPTFVRMVENAQVERTLPPNEYHYVPLTNTKSCVAPLTSDLPAGKSPKDKVVYNFWAVGSDDCCVS